MRTNGYWRHCALAIAVVVVTSLGLFTALGGVTRTAPTSVPIVVGVTSAPIVASQSDDPAPYRVDNRMQLQCSGEDGEIVSVFTDGKPPTVASETQLIAKLRLNKQGQASSLSIEVQAGFNQSVTGLLIVERGSKQTHPVRHFIAQGTGWSTVIDIAGSTDELGQALTLNPPWIVHACTAPAA